jgi:hypothetical protein
VRGTYHEVLSKEHRVGPIGNTIIIYYHLPVLFFQDITGDERSRTKCKGNVKLMVFSKECFLLLRFKNRGDQQSLQ